MRYNRFSGDPAVKLTPDGAKMLFVGGQPVMDAGLNNAALISLYTKLGWWGNALLTDPNQQIGSDFEEVRTIVDRQTINDYTDSANRALQSMIDSGISQRNEVTVTNPKGDQIQTEIKIYPPGQDVQQLLLLKNGINWINQAINPAHERMMEVR